MCISEKKFKEIESQFGAHVSWAIWNDSDSFDYNKANRTERLEMIKNLEHFKDMEILKELKPNIVMTGLNSTMSTDIWEAFHVGNNDFELYKAFNKHNVFRGSYLTDIIKDDNINGTDGWQIIKHMPDKDKQKHVNKFIAELQLLNQKEISLTVFGGAAKELVCPFMPQIVNKGNISEVKFIYHPSYHGFKKTYVEQNLNGFGLKNKKSLSIKLCK
jgi:hypothetical protein